MLITVTSNDDDWGGSNDRHRAIYVVHFVDSQRPVAKNDADLPIRRGRLNCLVSKKKGGYSSKKFFKRCF